MVNTIHFIANNLYESIAPPDSVISPYVINAQHTVSYIGIYIGAALGVLIVILAYIRFPRKKPTEEDLKELKEQGITYIASSEEVNAIKKDKEIALIQPRFLIHQEYALMIQGSPEHFKEKFLRSRIRQEDLTQDVYTVYISNLSDTQIKNLRIKRKKNATFYAQYDDPFSILHRNKVTYNCVYQANKEKPNEKKKHRPGNNNLINFITGRMRISKEKR